MKILSIVAVVFSLLGGINVAMAEYDHQGVVTGSQSNEAANSNSDYEYGSRSNGRANSTRGYEYRR